MSANPTVSVVVPFLNAEKFIAEAVESVFRQTYRDWELLLVDDGSSDLSTDLAQRYAEQYSGKVGYFEHSGHENRGACASRNLAIRHAKGAYIALLDADDMWLPQKIEQQVGLLTTHPEAGMVCGRSQLWHSWTGTAADRQRDVLYGLNLQQESLAKPPELLKLSLQRKSGTPCPSDVMLRRNLVESIGGFEEAFTGIYQHCEDQAFFYKVYLKACVFVSGEYWDRYRVHPGSCTALLRKSGGADSVWLFFLQWLESYLFRQGVTDPEIWQALEREFWPYRHLRASRMLRAAERRLGEIKRGMKTAARRVMPPAARRWVRARCLKP